MCSTSICSNAAICRESCQLVGESKCLVCVELEDFFLEGGGWLEPLFSSLYTSLSIFPHSSPGLTQWKPLFLGGVSIPSQPLGGCVSLYLGWLVPHQGGKKNPQKNKRKNLVNYFKGEALMVLCKLVMFQICKTENQIETFTRSRHRGPS